MSTAKNEIDPRTVRLAFILPFLVFMGFLALSGLIGKLALDYSVSSGNKVSFLLLEPKYWVYPLQTLVCGWLLLHYRKFYEFKWRTGFWLATLMGVVVLVIWISPQLIFGKEPRVDGFDPTVFEDQPAWMAFTYFFRLLRLVVVVPFLEEIFWRGFLMRYLVRDPFTTVPFGAFTPLSFVAVALLFGLAHSGPDFYAAVVTGLLYNALAVWTRSLGACVWAHALTNLLLGIYIIQTGQWGFW